MDGTLRPPIEEPTSNIDWQSLPEGIRKALVLAQAHVSTVPNDKEAKTGTFSYKYASAAAIMTMARTALGKAGLACICTRAEPEGSGVVVVMRLIHDSAISPEIVVRGPMHNMREPIKSLGATLSYLKKYAYSMILGMAWDDPTEDVEQSPAGQRPQNRGGWNDARPPARNQQQRPAQKPPKRDGAEPTQDKLRDRARKAAKFLIANGVHREMIYSFVTGIDEPMPAKVDERFHRATIRAAMAVGHAVKHEQPVPSASHAALLDYMSENTELAPVYRHGKIQAAAEPDSRAQSTGDSSP